jgi:hypothetical protein
MEYLVHILTGGVLERKEHENVLVADRDRQPVLILEASVFSSVLALSTINILNMLVSLTYLSGFV